MTDYRNKLVRSGSRWCSRDDLERLRRETDLGDPKAERDYLRAQFRCGDINKKQYKERVLEIQIRDGSLCLANAAIAIVGAGSWRLPRNNIWNIPDGTNEVRFEIETFGPWHTISRIRGLCIDLSGCVYGVRSLSKPREDGYVLRGYVSLKGKKYRAFTSSKLFERPDGTLCDVGVLVVHNPTKRGIFDG